MPKKELNNGLKGKPIPLTVKLLDTEEVFTLHNVTGYMKIKELKAYLEFCAGIPVSLQKLYYLDEADLQDNSDIRSNDIVAGGQLYMKVWHSWIPLVRAVALNDLNQVLKLGVVDNSDLSTPAYDYMNKTQKQAWIAERAFIALFVACHRGHDKIVDTLIKLGANVNTKTALGRTPLHVAAAQGRGQIVDSLLQNGADVNAEDNDGESALGIAESFGNKDGARHLFLFRWQVRAAQAKKCPEVPMYFHQQCDTANPVWLAGQQGQVYYAAKETYNEEYSGTGLDSGFAVDKPSDILPVLKPPSTKDRTKLKIDFESWLNEKQKKEELQMSKIKEEKIAKKMEEEKNYRTRQEFRQIGRRRASNPPLNFNNNSFTVRFGKEQTLIDKESFETWVKKQQEQKERQQFLKKAKGKAARQAKEYAAKAGAAGLSVRSSDNFEKEAEPADNQASELLAFIMESKQSSFALKNPEETSPRKQDVIVDGNLIYQNDQATFDKVKSIQAKRAADKKNIGTLPL